jgi:hypothetical protein
MLYSGTSFGRLILPSLVPHLAQQARHRAYHVAGPLLLIGRAPTQGRLDGGLGMAGTRDH